MCAAAFVYKVYPRNKCRGFCRPAIFFKEQLQHSLKNRTDYRQTVQITIYSERNLYYFNHNLQNFHAILRKRVATSSMYVRQSRMQRLRSHKPHCPRGAKLVSDNMVKIKERRFKFFIFC